MRLLEMLVQELGSRSGVADALKVSRSTLSGWLNERDRHPSNSSLKRILDLVARVSPEDTERILEEELMVFKRAIDTFVRRGANSQSNES